MNQVSSRIAGSLKLHLLSCLVIFLLTALALAQQEVDPDHFDRTATAAQNQTAISHHEQAKTARKRTARKSETAKAEAQKAAQMAQVTQQAAK